MAVEIRPSFLPGKKKFLAGVVVPAVTMLLSPLLTQCFIALGADPASAATTTKTLIVTILVPLVAYLFNEASVDRARAKNMVGK